jgi:hypothetical protein
MESGQGWVRFDEPLSSAVCTLCDALLLGKLYLKGPQNMGLY